MVVLTLEGIPKPICLSERDGRIKHFRDGKVIEFENAGHWLHHDQFDRFIATLREFL